ncbi:hypothetical protein [Hydrogenimonas sp.]
MNDLRRFRPYLPEDIIFVFTRTREATGLSIGRILIEILMDSKKFEALEILTLGGSSDEEIREALMGPSFSEVMEQ